MHAGLRSALFGSALPLAGFDLGLDFKNSWYRSGAAVSRDVRALPTYQFARNTAKGEDVNGVLTMVAANEPLIVPGVGYFARPGRQNLIPNSTFVGAALNTPPNSMGGFAGTTTGINRQVMQRGVENGVEFVDMRIFGTATAATFLYPVFSGSSPTSAPVAAPGEMWSGAVSTKIVAGSIPPSLNVLLNLSPRSDDGQTIVATYPRQLVQAGQVVGPERAVISSAALPTGSQRMWLFLSIGVASGAEVDFTLRIMAPSLVKSVNIGQYMPTGGGTATAALDNMRLTVPTMPDVDWVVVSSAKVEVTSDQQTANIRIWRVWDGATERLGVYRNFGPGVVSGRINATVTGADGSNIRPPGGVVLPAGKMVTVLRKVGTTYDVITKGPDGAVTFGNKQTMASYPGPLGEFSVSHELDGVHEFFGWRRGTFSDDQVRTILAAI